MKRQIAWSTVFNYLSLNFTVAIKNDNNNQVWWFHISPPFQPTTSFITQKWLILLAWCQAVSVELQPSCPGKSQQQIFISSLPTQNG